MNNYPSLSELEEQIGSDLVKTVFKIHKLLGPGLLERVYEACVEYELKKLGYDVKRQVVIPITYDGLVFDEGLRLDILINDLVVVELKAVETLNPVWEAQILSHLKMMNLNLGYLINFTTPLMKSGIKRFRI
jgi:GxxExxY protein